MTTLAERQLGFRDTEALRHLEKALSEWLRPFLAEWMAAGPQPQPSADQVTNLEAWIKARATSHPPPPGYAWLPELARRLSGAMRFNERNLVNIHPSPHVPSLLAALMVSLQNPNNITDSVSKPTTELERLATSWLAEHLLQFDPSRAWGQVVSGGTVANMTALLVARDYTYRKLSLPRPANVRTRGLFHLPPGVVVATAGSHYSIRKALWFLGLGDENVVGIRVAFDEIAEAQVERDRLYVSGISRNNQFRELIEDSLITDRARSDELTRFYAGESCPFSLKPLSSEIYKALHGCFEYGTPLLSFVFTAGTTDTGTFEIPEERVLDVLAAEDIYIHLDAAAGGFAFGHPEIRERVKGLGRVHSVTLDGHKLGHLGYPNGAVIFRDKAWMYEILHEAPYLEHLAPTLEGSRPGSHVAALWAAIEDLGKTHVYEESLESLLQFCRHFIKRLDEPNSPLQVLHEVHLNTIAVAPRARPGDSRTYLNDVVLKTKELIDKDTTDDAFLVNLDRGLSGIKVRNSNHRAIGDVAGDGPLVDLYCLRIVAMRPSLQPSAAEALIDYLAAKIHAARRALNAN